MSASIYDPATKTLVPFAGTSISMMSELSDVELSAPSNGQVLRYDSSNQAWENADNVSDVSVTPVLSSGTKIATVTVDGSSTDLYAPSGGGSTGGGSSEDPNAYHTTDSAETSIFDTDYFPFLDGNTPKKSLWSNIKSVLKTYFDTLYDLNKDDIVKYAECVTGASTTAKTANVSRGSFKLVAGSKVAVRFSYANTATSPTLNINSTGAKEIKAINSSGAYVEPTNWNNQDIVTFIYNGSYYIMQPSFGTLPSLPVTPIP